MCAHTCAHMSVCTHTCVHTHMCVHIRVCVYVCAYTCVCIYMRVHMCLSVSVPCLGFSLMNQEAAFLFLPYSHFGNQKFEIPVHTSDKLAKQEAIHMTVMN